MIKYYTDAQIPKAIAEQLRRRGIDVIRCEDVGKRHATDEEHLEYAAAQGRVLITADSDFLRLDTEWREAGKDHQGILYIPPECQGVVGVVAEEAVFLYQSVVMGAATPEEMQNEVWRVRRSKR